MGGKTARAVAAAFGLLVVTAAAAAAQDKSQYSLFNPTPDRLLRDMTTDRPDLTEVPFTIDPGRIQVESTLFGYSRSRPDAAGAVSDTYELAVANVRIGLTSNTEIGFVWQPYGAIRTQGGPAGVVHQSGVGGLDIRAKINLWGNDTFEKQGTALALLPYITLPTDRHNGISPEFLEGGLTVPLAIKLPGKFGLGLNAGVVFLREDGSTGYHAEYLGTASLAYEWTSKFGTYYEIAARFGNDAGDMVMLGTGFTYKLSKNVQLDGGVNFGITPAADRINPFVGLSTRF